MKNFFNIYYYTTKKRIEVILTGRGKRVNGSYPSTKPQPQSRKGQCHTFIGWSGARIRISGVTEVPEFKSNEGQRNPLRRALKPARRTKVSADIEKSEILVVLFKDYGQKVCELLYFWSIVASPPTLRCCFRQH